LESAQYCAKFARGGQNDGFNGDKESANAATLKLDYSNCSSFFRSGKAVAKHDTFTVFFDLAGAKYLIRVRHSINRSGVCRRAGRTIRESVIGP
jgi:hypothetical protein